VENFNKLPGSFLGITAIAEISAASHKIARKWDILYIVYQKYKIGVGKRQ